MLKVLLVDDHPLFREGVRIALSSAPGIEVVGEADNGADAVQLAHDLSPDIVLMDLGMPGESGLAATRRITAQCASAQVLVVTMTEEEGALLAALAAGARGYLLKGSGRDELISAVHAVAAGSVVLGDRIGDRLATLLPQRDERAADQPVAALTARERDVLGLLAGGYDNRRIARQLVLSEKTVRNHVSNVFAKLGVTTRAEAVVRGRNAGLGTADPPGAS